jgi:hypothetical protein
MQRLTRNQPEIALPVASLSAVRKTLVDSLGDDEAARVLQAAGYAAGDAFFEVLAHGVVEADVGNGDGGIAADGDGARVARLPAGQFWQRLTELMARRGWGHLAHDPVHPGMAALETADWAEADSAEGALRPSCHFTTGVLANLLGSAAGQDVAVLEVECRSRGDLRCRFLFGGIEAVHAVYGEIAAGVGADAALAALS